MEGWQRHGNLSCFLQLRSRFGVHQPVVPREYRPWQTHMYKMYRHTVPARNSTCCHHTVAVLTHVLLGHQLLLRFASKVIVSTDIKNHRQADRFFLLCLSSRTYKTWTFMKWREFLFWFCRLQYFLFCTYSVCDEKVRNQWYQYNLCTKCTNCSKIRLVHAVPGAQNEHAQLA